MVGRACSFCSTDRVYIYVYVYVYKHTVWVIIEEYSGVYAIVHNS